LPFAKSVPSYALSYVREIFSVVDCKMKLDT